LIECGERNPMNKYENFTDEELSEAWFLRNGWVWKEGTDNHPYIKGYWVPPDSVGAHEMHANCPPNVAQSHDAFFKWVVPGMREHGLRMRYEDDDHDEALVWFERDYNNREVHPRIKSEAVTDKSLPRAGVIAALLAFDEKEKNK
jgi:hypothetical protein